MIMGGGGVVLYIVDYYSNKPTYIIIYIILSHFLSFLNKMTYKRFGYLGQTMCLYVLTTNRKPYLNNTKAMSNLTLAPNVNVKQTLAILDDV